VRAAFADRNVYCAFLVMVLPLLFGIAIHERSREQRIWVISLLAVAGLTMLAPPHVWLLLGVLCWMAYVRGGRYRTAFPVLAVAFALVVAVALPRNHDANVVELFDPYERGELFKLDIPAEPSADGAPAGGTAEPALIIKKRWLEWQPALAMLTENLPLGVGAGSFQTHIGEAEYYGSLPNVKKGEPDTNNFYLVVGASMGLAGLISVVAMLAWFWRQAAALWLRASSRVQRGLAAGLPGALVGIIAANLFTSLFVRGVSLVWALVFAMVTVVLRDVARPGGQAAAEPDHMP
jgi:O-antigen ligase